MSNDVIQKYHFLLTMTTQLVFGIFCHGRDKYLFVISILYKKQIEMKESIVIISN